MKNKVNKYSDAQVVRLHNRRITVSKKEDKICVLLQAVLPTEELNFNGCGIRGSFKQTCFGLTREAAMALCYSLNEVLNMQPVSKSNS
jgi:hypothetical protein